MSIESIKARLRRHDRQRMRYGYSDETAPQIWERDLRALLKVAEAAKDILWVFDCTCIEAYTDRGLHEPNAICGEGDGLSAALAALEADE